MCVCVSGAGDSQSLCLPAAQKQPHGLAGTPSGPAEALVGHATDPSHRDATDETGGAGGPGAHHPTALTWLGTNGPHGALRAPPPRTPCWLPLWPRVLATESGSVPAGRCPVTWWKQPPEPRTKVRAIHEPFRPSSSQSPSPPRMCRDLSSSVASWLWRPA